MKKKVRNKRKNVKITFPKNPKDPLIIEPINPKLDFELDLKEPGIKQYFKEGKLNFIVKGNSRKRADNG